MHFLANALGRRVRAFCSPLSPLRPLIQRKAGEWDTYPGGELEGGYDLPSSRHIASKHTVGPTFSVQKSDLIPWTRDARIYAKPVGFLRAFVSEPPQYIPVGELDT